MDLSLSAEQETLRNSARSLLSGKAPAEDVSSVLGTPERYDTALAELMVSLGWSSLGLVHDGGTLLDFGLVATQLGAHATPSPLPASVYAGLTVRRLAARNSDADAFVDTVASGRRATLVADPALRLEREGEGWTLDGAATAVEWAPTAADLVVVATVEGRRAVTVVDAAATGVGVETQEAMDGSLAGAVRFTGVVVQAPIAYVDAAAWREHCHLLRVLRAADMLGSAQTVLDMTLAHVRQREQFGRPIAEFQAVQHHLANVAVEVTGAEYLVHEALWREAVGLPFERHAAMAAWHTGEAAVRATQTANQLHGGIGFMKEFHLHHFFHRVAAQRGRMGSEQERLGDLGDVVVEAANRGFHGEFAEWPVEPRTGW